MTTHNPSIQELVIKALQNKALTGQKLLQAIQKNRPDTTKQGLYKTLRQLKEEEKIVQHGKSFSLNLHWLKEQAEWFNLAKFHYSTPENDPGNFLNLKPGDKITYYFKNLRLLDIFWSHALHSLMLATKNSAPVFVYNPHEWFTYARSESEQKLLQTARQQGRQILITIAKDYVLDKAMRHAFADKNVQYNINANVLKKGDNYYCNIIQDYLIEVWLDKNISKTIDTFFQTTTQLTADNKKQLQNIIQLQGKNRLSISKNPDKAERLTKKLSRDFYIKKTK
ncbi:MAG: hypothetical protein ACKKL5_00335 [Candidatus Komeilibacteria bacterium]